MFSSAELMFNDAELMFNDAEFKFNDVKHRINKKYKATIHRIKNKISYKKINL